MDETADSELGSGIMRPDGFSLSDFQTWTNSIGCLDTPSLQDISVRYEAAAPPPSVINVEPISTLAPPTYSKRPRGRPPRGRGRRKKLVVDESAITNLGELATHIIYVGAGEDIKKEVKEFARGKQSIVVLSGLGVLSDVNIENPNYGFSERQEGSLPILSLNGEYTQHGGTGEPVGQLKVTISCPDGRVRGGEVGKTMLAETQVQVIVASTQFPIPAAPPNFGDRPTTFIDDVYIPEGLPSLES